MNTFKFLTLAVLFIGFTSCSSDDDNSTPQLEVESQTITNLYAPQLGGQGQPTSGEFAKFDFATGQATTSETDWDIAFRGTSIIVNGGVSLGTTDEPNRSGNAAAYIATGTMASVAEVSVDSFIQDSETGYAITSGSGNGWYNYNPANNQIDPIPGKVLVFRTRDGKYAKVEILSYYLDSDTSNEARYYTFNYVYQPNEGVTTF
uniref:HmuY family protein n=1 Tax=Gelidibacter sp. TaxID=2018083 RepID=UPI00404912A3